MARTCRSQQSLLPWLLLSSFLVAAVLPEASIQSGDSDTARRDDSAQSGDSEEAPTHAGTHSGNSAALVDTEALIETQIYDIIELKPAGREFYEAAAKKVGKLGAAGCTMGALAGALLGSVVGPVGAAVGGAKGCAGAGFVMGLIAAVEAPFAHWSKATKAAYRARKAYTLSLTWLDIDAFEFVGVDLAKAKSIVHGRFRKMALRYHPDKLPSAATEQHRERAKTKLANCKFAKAYILAFQKKYGVLDPEDDEHAQGFLRTFAGAWAANFGSNEGAGSMSPQQVAEWMSAVKHHVDL